MSFTFSQPYLDPEVKIVSVVTLFHTTLGLEVRRRKFQRERDSLGWAVRRALTASKALKPHVATCIPKATAAVMPPHCASVACVSGIIRGAETQQGLASQLLSKGGEYHDVWTQACSEDAEDLLLVCVRSGEADLAETVSGGVSVHGRAYQEYAAFRVLLSEGS
ncbi:hypothetical protein KIPB_007591 [Kipferlia bialata]|uniref:Uncharacterized protein n=1 Tax=Kipferlia bialata TaxID=797122 RepID=A0A9K3D0D5_9EUKA|nr:hypothetical protein KIPB_007591 [Kipferlia bialata]|eukprot:g7591.t1